MTTGEKVLEEVLLEEVLLVDLGNTRLKWAILSGGTRSKTQSTEYRDQQLDEILSRCWREMKVPNRVIVASVGDDSVNRALAAWSHRKWSMTPRFLRSEASALGVRNAYLEPRTLGIDRWLGMIAVHRQLPCPAILVDCGTAITLDLLNGEGRHLGGLILPGLLMTQNALFDGTNMPRQHMPQAEKQLATDTAGAIASGSGQSVAALIERVADDYFTRHGTQPELVLTGSDGLIIQSLLARPARFEPDLVMQGLSLAAESTIT